MKKSALAVSLVVVFLLIVGSAAWLSLNKPSNTAGNGGTGTPQGVSGATDMTNKQSVDITIRDMSFSPPRIKVTKGTKVTWTNKDTVGHNVVASVPSSSGGLPVNSSLFGKGETFSHTFTTIGVFTYHCTPHPFMKGSVEVVD
jgi:amicyanin